MPAVRTSSSASAAAIADERRCAGFELSVQADGESRPADRGAGAPKRAPRGYPADHPRLELLRLKSLTVSKRHELAPWIHTAECDRTVRAELEATTPLIEWLSANVGPSTRTRPQ